MMAKYIYLDGDLFMVINNVKYKVDCPLSFNMDKTYVQKCTNACAYFEFYDGEITGTSIVLHCCKRTIKVEVVDPSEFKGG